MKQIFFIAFIAFTGIIAANAQDIISAAELDKIYKNANVVVVSAGTAAEYNKSHITGSIHIAYTAFDKTDKIKGLLMTPAQIAKILGDNGVSEKNTIVVYDEFDGRYAGRIYSLLKYLGAKDVKVLGGNFDAWKKARRPVTRNVTQVKKTTFTPSVNNSFMATINEADAASGKSGVILLDTRAPGEFQGREEGSKGYIPGAINMEYKELLDASGNLKSKAELQKVYNAKGATKDKEIILYCSTGVRTGLHYLALTSILGYNRVKIYDGGYNEYVERFPSKIKK
jgi:thiosulfate/3-mercaptopyruvate sulfurtransferase